MSDTDNMSAERQFLEKLLAERAELDQLIIAVQKRLGKTENVEIINHTVNETLSVNKGEFFGMSRAEAAIALLRKLKRTLSTNDIFKMLEESGLDMAGKNVLGSLYTSLTRHSETRRVAPNTWGLKEWYPHLKDAPLKDAKKKAGRTVDPEPTLDDEEPRPQTAEKS
jgi:hypothetical protein